MDRLDIEVEYAKWLSYTSDEETYRMMDIKSKPKDKLTIDDLKTLKGYKLGRIYSKLFRKYAFHLDTCDEKEKTLVKDFMDKHPLEEIMKSKLSKSEYEFGKKCTDLILNNTKEDIEYYIENYDGRHIYRYMKLSMINSYVYHEVASKMLKTKTI